MVDNNLLTFPIQIVKLRQTLTLGCLFCPDWSDPFLRSEEQWVGCLPSALVELRRDSKEHRQSGCRPEAGAGSGERISKKRDVQLQCCRLRCHSFRWIEQMFLNLCCFTCWQTIIIQLNGSFKLRKGLITSDLLLLCGWETVLKVQVLFEQSKFLVNFDRFFSDNYVAVFTGTDIHTSNAKHENWDCWTGFSISGSGKGLHCNQAVTFLRKIRGILTLLCALALPRVIHARFWCKVFELSTMLLNVPEHMWMVCSYCSKVRQTTLFVPISQRGCCCNNPHFCHPVQNQNLNSLLLWHYHN